MPRHIVCLTFDFDTQSGFIARGMTTPTSLSRGEFGLTGARRIQVFTHGVLPSVLPSLLGISLYRLDENIRSSLVLGFVGAGGLGFQLLTAMNLFQYQKVSVLLIVTFVIVLAAERLSAVARERLAA